MIKIAVMQYKIEQLGQWESWEDKIVRLVEQAKAENASFLALSEYAGLELAGWTKPDLITQFDYIHSLHDRYIELFRTLAKKYQIFIQPGTIPARIDKNLYRNRAYVFSPSGKMAHQDKIFLTPFERSTELLQADNKLNIIDVGFTKIGILTCYDCEFPTLARQLTSAGVKLILVPSCTEKISGLTRVSICSRARAIENQCYVAQSALIGTSSWCDYVDINTGQSGIYSPADKDFPEDGILALADLNRQMMIFADLNFEKLDHVREEGEMRNFIDTRVDIATQIEQSSVV
jgi:predicted amidohydrolase